MKICILKGMVSYVMMDGALSPLDTYGYMPFVPQASGAGAQQHQSSQHYGGGATSPQLMMLPADISEMFRPMKRVPYGKVWEEGWDFFNEFFE